MGRPKIQIGTNKAIACAHCGKSSSNGYRMQLNLSRAEVTPDFFISYDTDIEDFDSFFCSAKCIIDFLKEELKNVNGNG